MSLITMSFSAAVLIVAIVILRALLLHRLPKKTFLVLWGVALCRLLIPFAVPSRFSIYSVVYMLKDRLFEMDLPLAGMPAMANNTAITETTSPLPEVTYGTISPVLIIWFIGLGVCALFFLVTHLRCRKEYKTALPVDSEFVKLWQQKHPMRRKVQIRQSDRISAPLTYGIFRPVVLLPKQTDWADETRLKYILTHEFVHIRRFDTLTKLVMATALCVHWFNPCVWLMYVLANRDIELSCDEAVVRTFGGSVKSVYALTLIGLEEEKNHLAPFVNNFSKNAIEERVVSIMKIKKISAFCIIGAICLVVGVTAAFATSFKDNSPQTVSLPGKYDSQYISELEQGHHTGDLDPQNVLMTYISEKKYDFNDFVLRLDEDIKKTYVYPDGKIEIQLIAYDIQTSTGNIVRVWDAQPYSYHEF